MVQESAGHLQRFSLTALSAMAAEATTFPVDTVKTRLQLLGESAGQPSGAGGSAGGAPPRPGPTSVLRSILANEGPRSLYAGLGAAVLRHVPYTGTRIAVYERLRESARDPSTGAPQGGVLARVAMGGAAGALGQLVSVPADLVKVRMQADGQNVALGRQSAPRYRGAFDGLARIVREEGGVAALWRGAGPAIQRAALVNIGELATYDSAKGAILDAGLVGDTPACHVLSAATSGLVASFLSTPLDVAKSRIMNQDPLNPRYRGVVDCLVQTSRKEGMRALYKGFLLTWSRLGPWQLTFWVTYEQMRGSLGMGSF